MIVVTDDCVECGSRAEVCPEEAISEGDGKFVIDQEKCIDSLPSAFLHDLASSHERLAV